MTGGVDPDARLVEAVDDLRRQTCADVLAAAAIGERSADDLPTLKDLVEATGQAADDPIWFSSRRGRSRAPPADRSS